MDTYQTSIARSNIRMKTSTRTLKTVTDPILLKSQSTKMLLKAPTSTRLNSAMKMLQQMGILLVN